MATKPTTATSIPLARESAVTAALESKGLMVVQIANGRWAQHPDPLSYQDFVLAQRAAG